MDNAGSNVTAPGGATKLPSQPSREGLVDPSLVDLFVGFLGVAVTSFGGVVPITRRMLIDTRRWISEDEFNELLSLCQFLPGPNIGNMSVAVGARFHGIPGAFFAVMGLMLAPCCIAISLAQVYEHFAQATVIRHVFIGIAAVASGMIFGLAGKIAATVVKRRAVHGIIFMALPFLAVGVLSWPLLAVLAVVAPLSILAYGKTPWKWPLGRWGAGS
jgi:chromate transporter